MTKPRPYAAPDFWLVLLASLYWTLDLALLRSGVPHPLDDIWEYAVAARALIEGDAFRTPMIHPPLWAMRDAMGTVPILIHGPLLPLLFVPLVWIFGAHAPEASASLAAAFALLAAWLSFRLGTMVSGRAVGIAAAALFTLSPLTIRAVHHDPALVVGATLFAGALVLLVDPARRRLVAGAALGVCYLARPEMLLAAPVLAIAAGRGAPWLLLGFVLAAAPWWAHQWLATGQPFFNLSSYLLIGYWWRHELSPLRDFALTPARWPETLAAILPALPAKWAALFPHAAKRALMAPAATVGWLAAVGFAGGTFVRERHRMAAVAIALAAIPVVVQTLTVYDSRYLVPFLPLWAVAAAWAAERLTAKASWLARPGVWIPALLLLALPPAVSELREAAAEAGALRPRLAANRAAVAGRAVSRADRMAAGPLFSDTPDFVAWTTGRTVLWLSPAEYRRLPAPEEPNPLALPVRGAEGYIALADSVLTAPPPVR